MAQGEEARSLVSGTDQELEIAMINAAVQLTKHAVGTTPPDVAKKYKDMYRSIVEAYNDHHQLT